MPSPLQQLENNEAVLLMYAADELSPEDRAEVEQMLASDGGMRSALDSIREGLATVDAALGDLDEITRLPMSSAVAVRRLGPAMAEWQLQRLAPPAAAPVPSPLRYAWWTYPVASAAAILLAVTVWWGVAGKDINAGDVANNTESTQAPESQPTDNSTAADRDNHDLRSRGPGDGGPGRGPGFMMMQLEPNDAELSDAEQQVASLSKPSGDQASPSSIFMTDSQND